MGCGELLASQDCFDRMGEAVARVRDGVFGTIGDVVVRSDEDGAVIGDFAALFPLLFRVGVVTVETDLYGSNGDTEFVGGGGGCGGPGLRGGAGSGDQHEAAVGTGQV